MKKDFDIERHTAEAIKCFWRIKDKQLKHSSDSSNRGAVTGGKQLDGFLTLLRLASTSVGVPLECIYNKNNYVPGFYRSSKD